MFLSLAILGVSGNPCFAETLSSLITDTRVLIYDASSASRQRYSDTQITELLNVAQRQAVANTNCLENSFQFTLQLGVTYYQLPSDYLGIERVTIGNLNIQELTPAGLDGRSRGWESSSGYPTYYFVNWSSPTLIGFAPFPQVATDTAPIKVEYTQNAADLVNSSDVPFNGVPKYSEYHHALSYYAASIVESGYGRSDLAAAYMGVYTSTIGMMKTRCRQRVNYLPSASGAQ